MLVHQLRSGPAAVAAASTPPTGLEVANLDPQRLDLDPRMVLLEGEPSNVVGGIGHLDLLDDLGVGDLGGGHLNPGLARSKLTSSWSSVADRRKHRIVDV